MHRANLMLLVFSISFLILLTRAFWIQGPGNLFYAKEGEKRFQRNLKLTAIRGKIFDRSGILLATSLEVYDIWAIPSQLHQYHTHENFMKLAYILDLTTKQLREKINIDKSFVYLKRQVSPAIAEKIAKLSMLGVYQRSEYKRFYPGGHATAHIIGFADIDERGQEGIELSEEKNLAGQDGLRKIHKDNRGRVIEELELRTSFPGQNFHLSIDSKIQSLAFAELSAAVTKNQAKAGAAVVLSATTGEILAMVSMPSYDPNIRYGLTGAKLRNRALTDAFEPGSTVKPFTIAAALELGKLKPNTIIDTGNGQFKVAGHTIRDTKAHGLLKVSQVIQKSSNIGTLKIGLELPAQKLWQIFFKSGFGTAPQIGFPGATAGKLRPYASWKKIEQATMSYGYGFSASLLQLARSYTIFADNGVLMPLSIIKLNNYETYKNTTHKVAKTQVISPKTAKIIRNMLELAASNEGSAPLAQPESYKVGGKSGTAYRHLGKGYASHSYNSFFVGLAPINAPQIVIAVMLEDPAAGAYYGGKVAAPVFAAIAQNTLRSLNILPDKLTSPIVITKALSNEL